MISSEFQDLHFGGYQVPVDVELKALTEQHFCRRMWEKDATLWKTEPDHQKEIKNRLGWLQSPQGMRASVNEINAFVDEVRQAGFTHALLLGMGGSSLCPEVMRITFGVKPGYLDLAVLDSTDPAMVLEREKALDLEKTLFIVASKSGTTIEVNTFYQYFYDKVKTIKGDRAGENFVAITDPGTKMEKEAIDRNFRKAFLNPSDIGGRYSALSFFGLVPSALIGIDVATLLDRAIDIINECSGVSEILSPAIILGNALGQLAKMGRDKLTFILSEPVASFGDWVEQLVAESLGKEGKGIIPVVGEPAGDPSVYGEDRVFVYVRLEPAQNQELDEQVRALDAAGNPVVYIHLRDLLDLGHEYFRWEIATAAAGMVLKVNPFDQPNVQESKTITGQYLADYVQKGSLPKDKAILTEDEISLFCDDETEKTLAASPEAQKYAEGSLMSYLAGHLYQLQPGDYLAFNAFIPMTSDNTSELQAMRLTIRDNLSPATTMGFGPRFLHSTGQLHKGGPNTGVFFEISHEPSEKVIIPGEQFDFGTLLKAQALGDFNALQGKDRRAIRLHLNGDVTAGLNKIRSMIEEIVQNA